MEQQITEHLVEVGLLFGLHPWDIVRLTYGQWCAYRDFSDEHQRRPSDG
ncbi:MAG: hypothetical protein IPJ61_21450 [Tessaracoccus sp.]|nr:hypothetical protein [Tessaracoccus sp.]MBK7823555.1 hypothetical protein [Tessaracoccus sp.]